MVANPGIFRGGAPRASGGSSTSDLLGATGVGFGLGRGIGGDVSNFILNRLSQDFARRENRAATATSFNVLRRLLGAVGPNDLALDPSLAEDVVRQGDFDANFLPVGSVRPREGSFGVDLDVFRARETLFRLLSNDAFSEASRGRLAQIEERRAAEQLELPEITSTQQLEAALSPGSLGNVGLAGASSRISTALANRQFRRQAAGQASDFVRNLFQLAGGAA